MLTNYIERSTDPYQVDGSYLLEPGTTQNVWVALHAAASAEQSELPESQRLACCHTWNSMLQPSTGAGVLHVSEASPCHPLP